MRKRTMRRLLAAAIISLVSLAVVVLALLRSEPISSFQFLDGRKPLLYEKFSCFTVTIYSFPAAWEEVCSQASAELASLGFKNTYHPQRASDNRSFHKLDRNNLAEVIISRTKLLDETTATQYVYEHAPGWVSVEITQSRTNWRYYLNRVSRGLIPPPPPDLPIGRSVRSEIKIADEATQQSR